jgi:hypothetical protein
MLNNYSKRRLILSFLLFYSEEYTKLKFFGEYYEEISFGYFYDHNLGKTVLFI